MREVVRELRQLLHITVQPVQHEVDGMCQVAQLVRKALHFHAMRQVAGRDQRGDFPERPQRPEPATHHPPDAKADQQQNHRQGQAGRSDVSVQQNGVAFPVHGQPDQHVLTGLEAYGPVTQQNLVALGGFQFLKALRQRIGIGNRQTSSLLVTDAHQFLPRVAHVENGQREAVMPDDLVTQRVRVLDDVDNAQKPLAHAVFDLPELLVQTVFGTYIELTGNGCVGEHFHDQHQAPNECRDRQSETCRETGQLHSRTSST